MTFPMPPVATSIGLRWWILSTLGALAAATQLYPVAAQTPPQISVEH